MVGETTVLDGAVLAHFTDSHALGAWLALGLRTRQAPWLRHCQEILLAALHIVIVRLSRV